jgi:hypothetical protein
MSFDSLTSDYKPKREEILITIGKDKDEKKLTFYANEISFLQRLGLDGIRQQGLDVHSYFIVYSITDSDGKHMTLEQAQALSQDHAMAFFNAAARVNSLLDGAEKN